MTQAMTMDDGVQFGLGAFETIAVERGKGILLSRHLARLGRSAQFLGLGDLAERGLTMERAAEWISENCPEHSACKILLTQENLMMRLRPNPYGPARYARGFRMDFSAVRRNETSPLTGHKTLNYGDCILEHRAAAAAGMDERIFLNTRGMLAEGTVSTDYQPFPYHHYRQPLKRPAGCCPACCDRIFSSAIAWRRGRSTRASWRTLMSASLPTPSWASCPFGSLGSASFRAARRRIACALPMKRKKEHSNKKAPDQNGSCS